MITKKELKQINSLATKKARKTEQQFLVEGKKSVEEFIEGGFQPKKLFSTENTKLEGAVFVTESEMQKMSCLKNASPYLGVFEIPKANALPNKGRILILDKVADPGNLGTILRICDWFGIKNIIGSLDTVDCYNPKVVQASMASLARVQCQYTDLNEFLSNTSLPIFGTYLVGKSIYETAFPEDAILVMGSEANGISTELEALIEQKVTIPKKTVNGPESLNVAIATALVLGEITR